MSTRMFGTRSADGLVNGDAVMQGRNVFQCRGFWGLGDNFVSHIPVTLKKDPRPNLEWQLGLPSLKHGLRRSRKKYYESRHCLSNGWGSPLVTYPRVRIRSGQRKRGELLYAVAGHALRLRRPSLLVSDDREIVSEGLDSFRSILLCGPGTCPPSSSLAVPCWPRCSKQTTRGYGTNSFYKIDRDSRGRVAKR